MSKKDEKYRERCDEEEENCRNKLFVDATKNLFYSPKFKDRVKNHFHLIFSIIITIHEVEILKTHISRGNQKFFLCLSYEYLQNKITQISIS